MGKKHREIVHIDEERCDGCGQCVPNCAEGAIKVIDGKARLLAENLCDGLGACLGHCPRDAIRVEKREAEDFDEEAVKLQLAKDKAQAEAKTQAFVSPCGCTPAVPEKTGDPIGLGGSGQGFPVPGGQPFSSPGGGCPGSRQRTFAPKPDAGAQDAGAAESSQLGQWPVQLTLLPEQGPLWDGVDLIFAADCAPFAMGGFHSKLLKGRKLAIACPKLDDAQSYVDKLARIFSANDVRSVTVARMEVPCCGLDQVAHMALRKAKKAIPLTVVTIGVRGDILSTDSVPAALS